MVASGPTVLDNTTNAQASAILAKYDVLAMCQLPSCNLLETPKEQKYFANAHNILFVSAKQALAAMGETADNLGFNVKIFSDSYQGEARELALKIIAQSQKGQCLLGAGESTVKIIGKGTGGRQQEMALAALSSLHENQVLICLASDGRDNSDSAGAIIDSSSLVRAKTLNLEPKTYLDNNDSFSFFEQLGAQVITGATSANVSDFFVMLN
jgi:glycerate-2-kinase